MKNVFFFLFLTVYVFLLSSCDKKNDSQDTDFSQAMTDERFLEYCLRNFDLNGDGILSEDEILLVLEIDVAGKGIESLEGIECFLNLEILNCYNNKLVEVDLTKNAKLQELYCSYNDISSLDLSGNAKLSQIAIHDNPLSFLSFGDIAIPGIFSSDKDNQTYVEYIDLSDGGLGVSESLKVVSSKLTKIRCANNKLTLLDVSESPELMVLDAVGNKISHIDLSENRMIKDLRLNHNELGVLDMGNLKKLETLWCDCNKISVLNVSKCEALKTLSLGGNPLTLLDVGSLQLNYTIEYYAKNNLYHDYLDLSGGDITGVSSSSSLKVISSHLERIICSGNPSLVSLDIMQCPNLKYLSVDDNNLSSIEVSENCQLKELWCSDNNIRKLNLSHYQHPIVFFCENNPISEINLGDREFDHPGSTMGNRQMNVFYVRSRIKTSTSLKIISSKVKYIDLCSNNLTSLDVSGCPALEKLYCSENKLGSVSTAGCKVLSDFDCSNNMLDRIDVSENKALAYLYCNKNSLTEIDISNNLNLIRFWCNVNSVQSLTIGNKPQLEEIVCSKNKLVSLDLINCPNLKDLSCTNNLFSVLDVSNNLSLEGLLCEENPDLKELWLQTGQYIHRFGVDNTVTTIFYK